MPADCANSSDRVGMEDEGQPEEDVFRVKLYEYKPQYEAGNAAGEGESHGGNWSRRFNWVINEYTNMSHQQLLPEKQEYALRYFFIIVRPRHMF